MAYVSCKVLDEEGIDKLNRRINSRVRDLIAQMTSQSGVAGAVAELMRRMVLTKSAPDLSGFQIEASGRGAAAREFINSYHAIVKEEISRALAEPNALTERKVTVPTHLIGDDDCVLPEADPLDEDYDQLELGLEPQARKIGFTIH